MEYPFEKDSKQNLLKSAIPQRNLMKEKFIGFPTIIVWTHQ